MSNVLENVLKRWKKQEKHNPRIGWLKREKEEIEKVLSGRLSIQRILRCGHCKLAVLANGRVTECENYDSTINREFTCPECNGIIRSDYIYKPRISGIRR